MKILFLTRLFYPHVGGVEKHIERVSWELIKKGHKITVLTTKFDKTLPYSELVYESKVKKSGKKHKIKIIRFDQPKIKLVGLLYTWLWLWKNRTLIKESDIVHIHDVFIWYFPFRFFFPKKAVYTTFHGWEGKYPIPLNNILQKRLAAIHSKGTICVGEYIKKYYGIKADFVTYGATDIPKSISKKDGKKIVYVGRLDKDTGLPIFLEALGKLKNYYSIDFCGDGELSRECNLFGKVYGFVDPKPYIAKASICFASGYLTILEALIFKCLVIVAYDNSLKKDYYELSPFSDFIVKVKKSKEIMDWLKYYDKHKDKLRIKREKGYNWAREQTWEKLSRVYLGLWQKKKE